MQPEVTPTTVVPEDTHWRRTLYAMWVAMFFVFLEGTFGAAFLPVFLQKDLHLTFHQAELWTGYMIVVPSLTMFLAQPLWGIYADRHGRKPIVIIGIVSASILRALWAFVHAPITIVVLGGLAGALGAGVVTGQAILACTAPKHRLGEIMGKLATAMTVGFLIGPVIGQKCAALIGPRHTFLLQALFALIGAIVLWLFVDERFEKPERPQHASIREAFLRDLQPMFGNRQLLMLVLTTFVVFFGWSSMWPIMAYYIQSLGIPLANVAAYTSYVMLVVGVVQTASVPFLGKLGDRIGQKRVLVWSTFGSGFFILPHAFVQSYTQFFGLRMAATAIGGGVGPTSSALAAQALPEEHHGKTYGLLAAARSLAAVFGPLVGSHLAAAGHIRGVFVWTGVITMSAALWAHFAVRENPSKTPVYARESSAEG
jgi:MFS transporter, DHA1 family, multidrug resistance protein